MAFLKNTSKNTINAVIFAISVVVPALVIAMLKFSPPEFTHSLNLSFFPKFNAIVNTLTFFCLLAGFYFIKNKNIKAHKTMMLTALVLSCIFLLSYVIYHTLKAEDSRYLGKTFLRYIYYFILITHIFLSLIVLPLVLKPFAFAFQDKIIHHRRWAKYTFPLWLYVALSGVLVYVFMAPYY